MREFCSTEGYLLIRVWDIFSNSEYQPPTSEMKFMEEVQQACHDAVFILDKWIDWEENNKVFDYEYADANGPDSLAHVIYEVVTDEESSDLDARVIAWLRGNNLPLVEVHSV